MDPVASLSENRELASFPKFHLGLTAITHFPEKVNDYFNDNFGFRRLLIRSYGEMMVRVFQQPADWSVILGKDGWMFYAASYGLEYYQTRTPFSNADLENWRSILERNRDLMASRGIHFLFVIAPNKETIYPEYMANNVVRFHPESRLDQLVAYMGEHSDVEILDLRQALISAKGNALLYDRSDTHWNGNGAYVGYQAILQRTRLWYPAADAFPKEDFIIHSENGNGDLIAFLGLQDVLTDTIIDLVPGPALHAYPAEYKLPTLGGREIPYYQKPQAFQIDDPSLPQLVVFHDSFGGRLLPLLAQNFRRSVFFPLDYPNRFEKPVSILTHEHADIVIFVMVERSLQGQPPSLS